MTTMTTLTGKAGQLLRHAQARNQFFSWPRKLTRPSVSITDARMQRDTGIESQGGLLNESAKPPRILITGGLDQLGGGLSQVLRQKYGKENVLLSDILEPSKARAVTSNAGPFIQLDILDFRRMREIVVKYHIDWIIHLSAVVSARGEANIPLAMRVNIQGIHNVLELAHQHHLKLFVPSTIGAFGPDSPRNPTPDLTIQRPRTIYGVSKVHAELMGEYYNHRFGLDFRCLRFPGIISDDIAAGGGTTDYTCTIFEDALVHGHHQCYLRADTRLPVMYIDDCLRSVTEFMEVPTHQLTMRTYNVHAMSVTPGELVEELRHYIPQLTVEYIPDARQDIADSWPQVFDDRGARSDWNWQPKYNLQDLTRTMLHTLSRKHNKPMPKRID